MHRSKLFSQQSALLVTVLSALMLLSGCVKNGSLTFMDRDETTWQYNYQRVNCDKIWQNDETKSFENSLYWLQLVNCSSKLTNEEINYLLSQNKDSGFWFDLFKRSIVLTRVDNSLPEQRTVLAKLGRLYQEHLVPTQLRPVMKLWLDNQQYKLALTNERVKYQRLKTIKEQQLDSLELELTTVQEKLIHLTEIEKQLSTRSSSDSVESVSKGDGAGSTKGESDKPLEPAQETKTSEQSEYLPQ